MKILWTRRAVRQFEALRDHIEQDNPKAAWRVGQRILKSISLLENQPHLGRPGRRAGTRELIVPETPYIVPYRVRGEHLELIAIIHGRQKWPTKRT